MELRPYQKDLVNGLRKAFRSGNQRVCAVLGCGGGKSVIQAAIAKSATDKQNRVLFIVHRKELCEQIYGSFAAAGVDFSYCQIGMVQTVTRRTSKIDTPKLILVDESHHILAEGYKRIIKAFPEALVAGFTATPIRLNEGGLGEIFQELVEGVSTKWLIEHNYLSPYKYYGVTLADTSKLHTKRGDYDKQEIEQLMNQSYIFGNAYDNWKKYADGKQTIIYSSSIECSKAVCEVFKAKGVQTYHLDGTTSQNERERIVGAFRDGKVKVLCNVDLFGEGFDVPDCECVVLLRPTKSLSLHIQQSMRSMRYKPNKTAIILDHVGNYLRHGLPDDPRTWSLESTKKKGEKNPVTIRQCPNCFSVMPSSVKVCPNCGQELVAKRDGVDDQKVVEDIMLEEISHKKYGEYKECTSFEELEKFRKAKKYKFSWTLHKCRELGIKIPRKYAYTCHMLGI